MVQKLIYIILQNSDEILRLTKNLNTANNLYASDYWLTDLSKANDHGTHGLFQNVKVVVLNFCLGGEDNSTLVLANQPTHSHESNSHFRNGAVGISECQYADKQCRADWFHEARMEHWDFPIVSSINNFLSVVMLHVVLYI